MSCRERGPRGSESASSLTTKSKSRLCSQADTPASTTTAATTSPRASAAASTGRTTGAITTLTALITADIDSAALLSTTASAGTTALLAAGSRSTAATAVAAALTAATSEATLVTTPWSTPLIAAPGTAALFPLTPFLSSLATIAALATFSWLSFATVPFLLASFAAIVTAFSALTAVVASLAALTSVVSAATTLAAAVAAPAPLTIATSTAAAAPALATLSATAAAALPIVASAASLQRRASRTGAADGRCVRRLLGTGSRLSRGFRIGEGLVELRVGIGQRLGVFGLGDPPRHGIRNGINGRARRLLDRHRDGDNARDIRRPRIDTIDIVARVVVLSLIDRVERLHASRQAVHLRLGIQLSHCLIARLRRSPRSDPNQLSNRRQRHAEDGDCQNHFEQRQPAAGNRSQASSVLESRKAHKVLWR